MAACRRAVLCPACPCTATAPDCLPLPAPGSLQASGRSDLAVVCEAQSHQGLTRFEQAPRLPLGVAFSTASFSARLLAQARAAAGCRRLPAGAGLHA